MNQSNSQGNRGVDPQPNHGKDDKGHKGGGVIGSPGNSHGLRA